MRHIILASHGELSKGLVHSAKMIVGDMAESITAYSLYPGGDAVDYALKLQEEIAVNGNAEYILITDLFGASVCSALIPLTSFKNVKLFTGLSLSMLLTLLAEYPNPLTDSDIKDLLEVGRNGIRKVNLEVKEDEDF